MDRQQEFKLRDIIAKFVGRTSAAGETHVDDKAMENLHYLEHELMPYLCDVFNYAQLEFDAKEASVHEIGMIKLNMLKALHQMCEDFLCIDEEA